MHPIICQIGPFTVYSYGLTLALAFFIASWLAVRQAARQSIAPEIISGVCFIAVVSGIAGARALFVLNNLRFYISHPLEILMLQHGGLSWFGGMLLAVLCSCLYLRRKKISVYTALDILVPFVVLAQAIGRIGCFLNGCCYGRPSKFGIYVDAGSELLIPTQIYSTLILLAIFVFLRFMQERPGLKAGTVFFLYILLYSAKRFFIEFFRGDNSPALWGLTPFQLFSVALFVVALTKLIMLHVGAGLKPAPTDTNDERRTTPRLRSG
ncbi:MAG: prolipoprotein diacylglyceryl transferase [Candidatus Omnitrophota bacterium]|nr:prolipoprotein diacylglyceryl transferase [Candidatus Omnitrophota bacterium]